MNVSEKNQTVITKASLYIFLLLAWLLLACIVIQTYFAGIAVFGNPSHWREHSSFVHKFQYIPILMFIIAFVGRFAKPLKWQSAGLIIFIIIQYVTAHIPGAGAVHPVFALILFWQSCVVLRKANYQIRTYS